MRPGRNSLPQQLPPALVQRMRTGLALLLEAFDCAAALHCSVWEFAVNVGALRAAGCTNALLRTLVLLRHVEQAQEFTKATSRARRFRPCRGASFSARTFFVLTKEGAAFARTICPDVSPRVPPAADPRSTGDAILAPRWDPVLRELYLGTALVKRFKRPAPHQELILTALQEEGWPVRIDDPLPHSPGQDARQRLHEAIKGLNRHQAIPLLRFVGDGTGKGLRWQLQDPTPYD